MPSRPPRNTALIPLGIFTPAANSPPASVGLSSARRGRGVEKPTPLRRAILPGIFGAMDMHSSSDLLQLRDVSKSFTLSSGSLKVLDDVSLNVRAGEFVSILGTSGCGKSTLLRLIAGLDTEYSGSISYEGEPVTGPDLTRCIIFQEHRLFPWLTVEQNIQFAFSATKVPRHEQEERVAEQIRRVGLTGFEKAWPHQISGGMAQRAAIARALINRPKLLLLDEPLGALDALTRLRLQQELQRLWMDVGITMVMVTHDIEEAVFLADRIVVLYSRPGRIRRIVPVPLPHPRERTEALFNSIKHDVLGDFAADTP